MIAERTSQSRWPTANTSPESKGSDASITNNPGAPDDESPRRGNKPPEAVEDENQPDFPTS
jgi:hypothetical protein